MEITREKAEELFEKDKEELAATGEAIGLLTLVRKPSGEVYTVSDVNSHLLEGKEIIGWQGKFLHLTNYLLVAKTDNGGEFGTSDCGADVFYYKDGTVKYRVISPMHEEFVEREELVKAIFKKTESKSFTEEDLKWLDENGFKEQGVSTKDCKVYQKNFEDGLTCMKIKARLDEQTGNYLFFCDIVHKGVNLSQRDILSYDGDTMKEAVQEQTEVIGKLYQMLPSI